VLGQEGRLGQVLVNLLMNALQSFPEPRPEHNRIRVVARRQGADKVVVAVEDNGPGMSAEVLPRIFDPFFTTKPVGVGTGLGLSISHSLVKAMGGHLEVRSAPGEGSVFQVVLPVVACEEQEVQAARRAEDEARMSP
jgi:signal transduction histidine kinase